MGDLDGAGAVAANEFADVVGGIAELTGSGLGFDPFFEGAWEGEVHGGATVSGWAQRV